MSARHAARVTIEFVTPFLVGSGRTVEGDDADTQRGGADLEPVRDAHGLPAIPGTTLAGLLRSVVTAEEGEARAADVFGSAEEAGSRLWVTWARIHDAQDRPVDGLRFEAVADAVADAVLEDARTLIVRDHVRMSHRGTADAGGKFDHAEVPTGHRFTFDLLLEGEAEDPADLGTFDLLLEALASRTLRIGGSGRRGLGAFRVARCLTKTFDLTKAEDARAFTELPVRLDEDASSLTPRALTGNSAHTTRRLSLTLEPIAWWSFDGAEMWTQKDETKAPDFNPVREHRIEWRKGVGSVTPPCLYVPGSSIKGALAHRVAYHHNRLAGVFADEIEEFPGTAVGEDNPSVAALFGTGAGADDAHAGRVRIDDVWLKPKHAQRMQRLPHVSLDRFTGGVRSGILFDERVIDRGPPIRLALEVEGWDDLEATTRSAFRAAVADLCEERLSLGAGQGRGHGRFRAKGDVDAAWHTFENGGA